MLHASVSVIVLAGVLVPALELGSDDVHTDDLFPAFMGILA